MQQYNSNIEEFWQIRHELSSNEQKLSEAKLILNEIIEQLSQGTIKSVEKKSNIWTVNQWVKKAILLYFQVTSPQIYSNGLTSWYDKIPLQFPAALDTSYFQRCHYRLVPGSIIRAGSYIGKNTVIMPSFINIGAYIDDRTMIDTWSTIGSCAYIGKNCHISGGVGIGGVLEPIHNNPVIIEDDCFIGARSEIAEGVLIEQGAVIGMGVFIGASTKIVNRETGAIIYGRVPAYSVVVAGTLPAKEQGRPSLYCAVIVKQVDDSTRRKTTINELLREE